MLDALTLFVFTMCFLGLLLGSITDLKKREVPDLLNFGLIVFGFGIASITSLVFWSTTSILSALLGFVFCFLVSCIMFYTGQWGGGDAKMLMAIGALVGIPFSLLRSFLSLLFSNPSSITLQDIPSLFLFLFMVIFFGGIFGFCWLLVLIVRHWHQFVPAYLSALEERHARRRRYIIYVLLLIFFGIALLVQDFALQILSAVSALLLFVLYHSFLVIKVVEQIAFVKRIPVSHVTEGDWVAVDVIVDGKTIVSKKDLGMSREQLLELHHLARQGKISFVLVKYGIPFVPSFLIAFIVTVVLIL
jgi:hypothetical protein